MKKCKVCNQKGYAPFHGKGKILCSKHWKQMQDHGKIIKRTSRDPNEILDCETHCEVRLCDSKYHETGRAKIDKEDLKKIKNYRWHLDDVGYAVSKDKKNKKTLRLHSFLLGKKYGFWVDHII